MPMPAAGGVMPTYPMAYAPWFETRSYSLST